MASEILSVELARSFLAKLGEHIDQNINIMNQDGIIIASRDPSRVGTYHDAAHRLILTQSLIEIIEETIDLAPGVKPGVNLPIQQKGQFIGVVGVTGKPADVRSLAYAIKVSLETFMELENLRDQMLRQQAGMNRFIAHLLNPESSEGTALHELARRMGYDPVQPRTPILITLPPTIDPESGIRLLKEQALRSKQDIITSTSHKDILIFKLTNEIQSDSLKAWENSIRSYVKSIQKHLPESHCYVAMIQHDVSRFHLAYKELLWLKRHYEATNEPIHMLYCHIMAMLTDPIFHPEFVSIFEYTLALIKRRLSGKLPVWLPETLLALAKTNFSIQETADNLHLHRNSLTNRMKKIEDLLGLDILKESDWKDYIRIFAYYINQTMHHT
ncbi:CdaR family transcriptional regulator [Gracilinema caldarium]|uniref:Transcriptional regulator, CdaR n=1 Tax=Gracilinema caldarium (strain ATCC 51460 / DSM 7334 / H1) TaxID=744872 RepID=F8EYI6_GRAC1|nr:sugar diacid recognition domain-containing protein [Gracilinema caldarium]AEJ18418.1 transcriptional regulator, CdaR [Gracilinema caldarium DSM 7334]